MRICFVLSIVGITFLSKKGFRRKQFSIEVTSFFLVAPVRPLKRIAPTRTRPDHPALELQLTDKKQSTHRASVT